MNCLIPSSPPKNSGQETGNSGDKSGENSGASRGKTQEQVGGKTARNNKTSNNTNKNIFISSEEEAKKYFSEKGYKSNYKKFFLHYQAKKWKGIKDRLSQADLWEENFKEMNPDLYKKTLNDQNSASIETLNPEISKIRDDLRREVHLEYLQYFMDDIQKTESGFKITARNPEAIKYKEILDKFNIELQFNQ